MTTVLIRNTPWDHEHDARSALADKGSVRDTYWWNLWSRRDPPYRVIDDDIPIALLNTWTERGGGSLFTWLVLARKVRTEQFPTKSAAIQAIASWADVSERCIRNHPYTQDRPGDSGTVIYWQAEPVRRIDVPRPSSLKIRPNGWLVTDVAELSANGIDAST